MADSSVSPLSFGSTDYGYDELDENVDAHHSRTQQLVSDMEALCTASH